MPPAAESHLLFSILCAIFASVPVAVLIRRLTGSRWSNPLPALSLPSFDSPYAPPLTELAEPPPLPMAPENDAPWTRKDAFFAVVLALIVGVLMGPGMTLLMGHPVNEDGAAEMKFSVSLFVTQIIFQAGVIGIILAYLTVHRRYRLTPLFGLRSMGAAKTLGMAVLWLMAAYFMLIVITAAGLEPLLKSLTGLDLKPQGLVESAPDITDPVSRVLMFVTLCIGAPVMEELIFRGVLFNVAARWIHPVYATVATSLLFGVIHNNLLSLVPLTLLGLCFAEAYRRTGSLAVPMLMHAIFNCISFLAITYGVPEVQ